MDLTLPIREAKGPPAEGSQVAVFLPIRIKQSTAAYALAPIAFTGPGTEDNVTNFQEGRHREASQASSDNAEGFGAYPHSFTRRSGRISRDTSKFPPDALELSIKLGLPNALIGYARLALARFQRAEWIDYPRDFIRYHHKWTATQLGTFCDLCEEHVRYRPPASVVQRADNELIGQITRDFEILETGAFSEWMEQCHIPKGLIWKGRQWNPQGDLESWLRDLEESSQTKDIDSEMHSWLRDLEKMSPTEDVDQEVKPEKTTGCEEKKLLESASRQGHTKLKTNKVEKKAQRMLDLPNPLIGFARLVMARFKRRSWDQMPKRKLRLCHKWTWEQIDAFVQTCQEQLGAAPPKGVLLEADDELVGRQAAGEEIFETRAFKSWMIEKGIMKTRIWKMKDWDHDIQLRLWLTVMGDVPPASKWSLRPTRNIREMKQGRRQADAGKASGERHGGTTMAVFSFRESSKQLTLEQQKTRDTLKEKYEAELERMRAKDNIFRGIYVSKAQNLAFNGGASENEGTGV